MTQTKTSKRSGPRLINYIGEIRPEHFSLNEADLDQLVQRFFDQLPDFHTLEEFVSVSGFSESELTARYQTILKNDPLQEPQGGFKIKGRFRHVYTECHRVNQTIECLAANNIAKLGDIINASHKSLADDYEVSIPQVDELIRLLQQNGAAGARLMGAGFGGMVLAIAEEEQKEPLIDSIKDIYYHPKVGDNLENCILRCVVADGADQL